MIRESIFLINVLIIFTPISSKSLSNTSSIPQFHDILKLLPKEKIEAIEQEHLKKDEGFRAAVTVLQSNEWKDLVNALIKTPEYLDFTAMTGQYNIDIPQAISCIRNHIDSLIITEKTKAKPNLESFIKDVQAVLPLSEMAQALTEKLSNAEAKNLRDEVASIQNQKIADAVRNLPEAKKMKEILKDMEFDVEPYLALVYTFLGWVH